MKYESDISSLSGLSANFSNKSLDWQLDFLAILREIKKLVRQESVTLIEDLTANVEASVQSAEMRQDVIYEIEEALEYVVIYAIERSCSEKPALIDSFQNGLVWSLDRNACKVCGVDIHNGYDDDTYWYCRVDICADECGIGAAPHAFSYFHIRLDIAAREYLEGKHEAAYFKNMFVGSVLPEVFFAAMSIQQLQDIATWVRALRSTAFLCIPY